MKNVLFVLTLAVAVAAAIIYFNSRSKYSTPPSAAAVASAPESQLNQEIKSALSRYFGTDANNIQVRVQENAVSLAGEVAERSTKELAEEVVMSVDGVAVVHNFLDLNPDSVVTTRELIRNAELVARDAVIETGVKARLTSDIGAEAIDLNVEACDGIVSLRGELPDHQRHEVAVRTAESVAGVTKVIDLIQVTA